MSLILIYFFTLILCLLITVAIFRGGFWRNKENRSFLLFIFSAVLWIFSLTGIYFFAFYQFNLFYLSWSIRFAYATSVFIPFFLFRFFYFFPRESLKIWFPFRLFLDAFAPIIAILALFTQLIYIEPIIEYGVYVADVFGSMYWLYATYLLFQIIAIFSLCIYKILHLPSQAIERNKVLIVAFGSGIFALTVLLTNVLLPLFNIYILQFESPVFTLFFILPVFYAIVKYRFLDIKFIISKSLKIAFSVAVSVLMIYGLDYILNFFLGAVSVIFVHAITFPLAFLVYYKLYQFLNSRLFHDFVGTTGVEYFIEVVRELQRKFILYTSFSEFEESIQDTFCVKLRISKAQIIILNAKNKLHYSRLVNYFKHNNRLLVNKEIPFMTSGRNINKLSFAHELELLGEICIPLYHPSKALLGFLVLGKKPFDEPYTKEEIDILFEEYENNSTN